MAASSNAESTLAAWYTSHGRHDLPWRVTRDRWAVLVSEVMLHQTQVGRVTAVWPGFMARFPTPEAMAAGSPGDVIAAWGTLGYPRRARWLWESARCLATSGWPEDLTELPGVGGYTAAAVAAQVDGRDVTAVETNIRRVLERWAGRPLRPSAAAAATLDAGRPLEGRDRFLALMDVGALLCRPRTPRCGECPLRPGCARGASGVVTLDRRLRQPAYEGSFRQRRGQVLARLRAGPQPRHELDAAALASLIADGLADLDGDCARLPR